MTQPTLQKLRYTIVSCSSEEPEYPIQELLSQSPQSKGWQSTRFCDYPQEITLQFMSPVRLKQVQFLSHQSKISSKIEIYTYIPDSNYLYGGQEVKYRKLGYLSLDSNERTGYQARELKSVYIDAPCVYLKFLLHKHHTNKYNLFNQVGIIALSTFGDFLTNNPQPNIIQHKQEPQQQHYNENQFQAQFDQATLDRLKGLEMAKERAIREEDFEECKRLKEAIDRLKSIAIQLRQLDERKQIAIQNEDYDTAKIIKSEIERLRNAVAPDNLINRPQQFNDQYMQNNQQAYYDEQQNQQQIQGGGYPMNQQNSQYQQPSFSDQQQNFSKIHQDQQQQYNQPQYQEQNDDRPIQPAQNQQYSYPQEEESKNLSQQQYQQRANQSQKQNHDELVIPAIKNKGQNQNENEEFQGENQEQLTAEPLSQQAKTLADPLINVLGEDLCKKLFSKSWQLREQGLKEIESEIKQPKTINKDDPNSMFIACLGAVTNTLGDRIAQVSQQSMQCLKQLCQQSPTNLQNRGDYQGYLEKILSTLLEKIGETNQRIQKLAEESLFAMGQCSAIGNLHMSNAIATGSVIKVKFFQTSHKHLAARNSILVEFVNKYKIGKDVALTPCAEFAAKSVQHQNRDVRKEAIKLIQAINKFVGEQKIRPFFTGIPLQQMEVIEEVLGGKSVEDALKGEEPSKGNKKQVSEKHQQQNQDEKQQIETNAQGGKSGGGGAGDKNKKKESPLKRKKEDESSKVCQFCGKMNKDFLDNSKLDLHLWKECPLLTTCQNCAQVIEISTLMTHYQEDCENKKQFKNCARCKEPIHQDQYKKHTEQQTCQPAKALSVANRCCLCHQDIPPGQEGWKKHLAVDLCPNNERTIK